MIVKQCDGILLTRPIKDSLRLACELRRQRKSDDYHDDGYHIYIQPLLTIVATPTDDINTIETYQSCDFIFTSRHSVNFFVQYSSFRATTAWCVGKKTATAAKQAGFIKVYTSDEGNAESLKQFILDRINNLNTAHNSMGRHSATHRSFIHFSGHDVTLNFEKEIPHCRRVILYETHAATTLRSSVIRALKEGRIHHILLFSQKTAKTLRTLVDLPAHITLHTLSTEIASIFPNNPHSICPSENAMVLKLYEK